MWDEEDTTARWVNALCGFVFLLVAIAFGYLTIHYSFSSTYGYGYGYRRSGGMGVIFLGSIYLLIRCFWYAITRENNINRDDF
jgi:hypothetical protein